jgi:hypothetical protein
MTAVQWLSRDREKQEEKIIKEWEIFWGRMNMFTILVVVMVS